MLLALLGEDCLGHVLSYCEPEDKYMLTHVPELIPQSLLGDSGDVNVTCYAAHHGNVNLLKWATGRGQEIDECAIWEAVDARHAHAIRWLIQQGCDWSNALTDIVTESQYDSVKWAFENGFEMNDDVTYVPASCGDLEMFIWAVENGCTFDLRLLRLCLGYGVEDNVEKWLEENGYIDENEHYIAYGSPYHCEYIAKSAGWQDDDSD